MKKDSQPKRLWAHYLLNRWLDRIQIILCGGSLGISDDLINSWEESIKNVHRGHFEKNSHTKCLWVRYLMNCWLDCIQI